MKHTRFLVIDTETTGMVHGEDRIVEFAAVELIYANGTCTVGRDFSALVNPGIPIKPGASAAHHLTDEDVASAESEAEVMTTAAILLEPREATITAHNAAFDTGFLLDPWKATACTWRMSLHQWPDLESHKNQFLRYYFKLDVPQAKGLASHRALADAHVTAALLKHGLETLAATQPDLVDSWQGGEDFAAWCASPVLLTTCWFGAKHKGEKWTDVPKDYLRWMVKNVGDMDADTRFTVETMLSR